jgi:glycosyltransferase involved in cell wall biosynthesis
MQAGGAVNRRNLRVSSAEERAEIPASVARDQVHVDPDGPVGGAAGRVLVFQPALPSYRLGFFDRVSSALGSRFTVFYSPAGLGVLTDRGVQPAWSFALGPMLRPAPGVEWQVGALRQPIRRGDTVVVSGAPRGLTNLLLLLKARLVGARTLWWGQYWSSTSHPLRFAVRMMLMRLAHAVIFYTDDEVAAYRAGPGRSDRRPLFALNNGIDVEPIAARRAPYRASKRGWEILFLGRLTEKAEVHLLIQALAQPELADVVLHVLGDGEMREALEREARALGVDDRIIWHGGSTDEDRIAAVANRCRLFVYPGGVGLSLIHAMAYGLPAVVHDDRRRHMPEIAAFLDGVTGRSFVREDARDLARCLAILLTDAPLLERFSKQGVEVTATRFNTVMMAERFADALRQSREPAGHAD